ncbi:DnaJ domain-containing protein [Colletotrichum truncatum]|uniref:DnaJ domain-containing protein n=1 Tax=Colletotrichum truncatum TaxID=5467 RepID=A0ACC3YXW7_COLTU
MGAQQSSGRSHDETASQPAKTCYYELLAVERDATDEEIKKAYRKRALELHPDRNLADVENATRRFADVQAAYEVLSDPQERSWYDSHREAILRGADPEEINGSSPEFNNIKLTSTEDILSLIRRFNSTVPFTDESSGFFGIAKVTFDQLADEELAVGEYTPDDIPDYPTFGTAADKYETVARPFYSTWASFSTRKTFAWKDKYRLSDAPDRRVRRLMEKENKKLRDEAIREFNDAVRFLVTFVRKRDPRYLPNTQTAAERQESLRTAAAAQAARSRAANLEKLSEAAVPEWAQARNDGEAGGHFSESEGESEIEILECVVCSKTFKSEKSFEAHERSKKHLKAVQQLRRQMKIEDEDLNLGHTTSAPKEFAMVDRENGNFEDETSETYVVDQAIESPGAPLTSVSDYVSDSSSELLGDDEYASRADVENRLLTDESSFTKPNREARAQGDVTTILAGIEAVSLESEEDHKPRPKKVGKAKAKREKKAARQVAGEAQTGTHICGVCQASFSSKTKLFTHIRDLGHATPIPKPSRGNKKKR